ncbi:hypothetical protein [Neobacillus mesonae]|uniref:hypothetical protein n=1 Tax=Neobacillus mesonae TaxID=1193713 RepID=UPI000A74B626|nr:hypothetical protein [Neobacillus mesonae]
MDGNSYEKQHLKKLMAFRFDIPYWQFIIALDFTSFFACDISVLCGYCSDKGTIK